MASQIPFDVIPVAVAQEVVDRAPKPVPPTKELTAGNGRAVGSADAWLEAQAVNSVRHARALTLFKVGEFGTGPEAPSDGHLIAVNQLISRLRQELVRRTKKSPALSKVARQTLESKDLQRML